MAPKLPTRTSTVLAAMAAACGWTAGCSISPKPEPPDALPSLDSTLVTTTPASDYNSLSGLDGAPGSASPAGAVVRVWNLEAASDPIDAVVAEDGSFSAHFDVMAGDQVRVQLIDGAMRSVPVDLVVRADIGPALMAPHALGDCLFLEPPLEAVYPAVSVVQVRNECGADVEIAQPAWRRAVPGVVAGQGVTWPATIATGAAIPVPIAAQPGTGTFEEILFVRATAPQLDRRPVTVRGAAP